MHAPLGAMSRVAAGGLLLLLAAACAPVEPTRFYTLATAANPAPVAKPERELVVGLGPVALPEYLNRPDLVTRSGETQMRLADLDKWAEPLEALLPRIMAEDLLVMLGAKDVILLPQRRDLALDRIVEVDILRFDGDDAGHVVLDARWRVFDADNERLLKSGRSIISEQGAPPPDYNAVVAAMSRAAARVSEEIATSIAADAPLPPPKRPPATRRRPAVPQAAPPEPAAPPAPAPATPAT